MITYTIWYVEIQKNFFEFNPTIYIQNKVLSQGKNIIKATVPEKQLYNLSCVLTETQTINIWKQTFKCANN